MLCYVSVSYYASVFSVEKFGRFGVLDEYVELCDLCLRFVFWAVNVNFLGVLREESSSVDKVV